MAVVGVSSSIRGLTLIIESAAFADDVERALLDFIEDATDIFADDAEGDQLDAAQEHHAHDDGGKAGGELGQGEAFVNRPHGE